MTGEPSRHSASRALVVAVGVAIAAVGCSHRHGPAKQQPALASAWPSHGVDWAHPPVPDADGGPLAPPNRDILDRQLANGLRVIAVADPRLPLVSIATLHRAAGGREDGAAHGLAALTADLLDEGAGARDAGALADALAAAGARLDVDIATDYASTHTTATVEHLAPALALVADVVRRPRLRGADFDRIRAAHAEELAAERDRPRTLAALAFDRLVFGAHAYGFPAEGTAADVARITPFDVRAFYERAYGPATTTIVIVGAAPAAELARAVDTAFGDWEVRAPPPSPPPAPPPTPRRVLGYLDRPGATECAIVVGRRVDIAQGDRLAADVANAVLGGGPGARLDRRLHGELHLTTTIASSFWRGELGASWSALASVATADAPRAVAELLALVEAARTTDAPAADVAHAKLQLSRGIASVFDTTATTAHSLERLVVQDRPLSYTGFADRIAAITPTAARAAVDRAWAEPSVVVVGDWAAIGKPLSALGLTVVQLPEP